jgi:phosphoserine phosphatase
VWALVALFSCRNEHDPLPSWNETPVKQQIIAYITDSIRQIPAEDRVAVFDMDGTIACEAPLWFEMYSAVHGLMAKLDKDPDLIKEVEYQYAKKLYENPADTSVLNHWVVDGVNYTEQMIWKAYENTDHENYVEAARDYLSSATDPKFDMKLADMFYQPMLELIAYLKDNLFEVYIVSGSMQGLVWASCPQVIGFDRKHLLGTRQVMTASYHQGKCSFIIEQNIYLPKNDGDGKSLNIYSHTGKIPVLAFGNTINDFGMLHMASSSKYPHIALLLNHDDSIREYAYPPYHGQPYPGWQDSLKVNNWVQVDMSQAFKTVWKTDGLQ